MTTISDRNFGFVIAYLLPGFVVLLGVSLFSEAVRQWLVAPAGSSPTVGGFLYVTLGSVAAGVTASTVRWALLDSIHHATGLARPKWDFARLQNHVEAYAVLEQNHYRFYQCYGNGFVAIVFLVLCRLFTGAFGVVDVGLILLAVIFLAGSRDTLSKYYSRTTQLLAENPSTRRSKFVDEQSVTA